MKVASTHQKVKIVLHLLLETGFCLEKELECEEDHNQFLEATLEKLKNLKDQLKKERTNHVKNYFDSKFNQIKSENVSVISRSMSKNGVVYTGKIPFQNQNQNLSQNPNDALDYTDIKGPGDSDNHQLNIGVIPSTLRTSRDSNIISPVNNLNKMMVEFESRNLKNNFNQSQEQELNHTYEMDKLLDQNLSFDISSSKQDTIPVRKSKDDIQTERSSGILDSDSTLKAYKIESKTMKKYSHRTGGAVDIKPSDPMFLTYDKDRISSQNFPALQRPHIFETQNFDPDEEKFKKKSDKNVKQIERSELLKKYKKKLSSLKKNLRPKTTRNSIKFHQSRFQSKDIRNPLSSNSMTNLKNKSFTELGKTGGAKVNAQKMTNLRLNKSTNNFYLKNPFLDSLKDHNTRNQRMNYSMSRLNKSTTFRNRKTINLGKYSGSYRKLRQEGIQTILGKNHYRSAIEREPIAQTCSSSSKHKYSSKRIKQNIKSMLHRPKKKSTEEKPERKIASKKEKINNHKILNQSKQWKSSSSSKSELLNKHKRNSAGGNLRSSFLQQSNKARFNQFLRSGMIKKTNATIEGKSHL